MLGDTKFDRLADSRLFKRSHHVEREPKRFRLAGEIFGIDKKNREERISGKVKGLGFADRDKYGPDEKWDTKDPIKHTLSPTYYKNAGSV